MYDLQIFPNPCARVCQDSKTRANAGKSLEDMTADNLYRIALSGDYGEVGLMTLRKWDTNDRDPAGEMSDIRAFIEELDNLFLKGHILCAIPDNAGSEVFERCMHSANSQGKGSAESRTFGAFKLSLIHI